MDPWMQEYLERLDAMFDAYTDATRSLAEKVDALVDSWTISTPAVSHNHHPNPPPPTTSPESTTDASAPVPDVSCSTTKAQEIPTVAHVAAPVCIAMVPVTCSTDCSTQVDSVDEVHNAATTIHLEPTVDPIHQAVEQLAPVLATASIGTNTPSSAEGVSPVTTTTDVDPKAGVQELDALSVDTSTQVTSKADHDVALVIPSDPAPPVLTMCSTHCFNDNPSEGGNMVPLTYFLCARSHGGGCRKRPWPPPQSRWPPDHQPRSRRELQGWMVHTQLGTLFVIFVDLQPWPSWKYQFSRLSVLGGLSGFNVSAKLEVVSSKDAVHDWEFTSIRTDAWINSRFHETDCQTNNTATLAGFGMIELKAISCNGTLAIHAHCLSYWDFSNIGLVVSATTQKEKVKYQGRQSVACYILQPMEGVVYFVHQDASYDFYLEKFIWEMKLEITLFHLVRVHCGDQRSLLADREILEFTHAISCIHRTGVIDSLLHRGFCRCQCISTKACAQVLDKGYLNCHISLGEINSKMWQSSSVKCVQPANLVPAYLNSWTTSTSWHCNQCRSVVPFRRFWAHEIGGEVLGQMCYELLSVPILSLWWSCPPQLLHRPYCWFPCAILAACQWNSEGIAAYCDSFWACSSEHYGLRSVRDTSQVSFSTAGAPVRPLAQQSNNGSGIQSVLELSMEQFQGETPPCTILVLPCLGFSTSYKSYAWSPSVSSYEVRVQGKLQLKLPGPSFSCVYRAVQFADDSSLETLFSSIHLMDKHMGMPEYYAQIPSKQAPENWVLLFHLAYLTGQHIHALKIWRRAKLLHPTTQILNEPQSQVTFDTSMGARTSSLVQQLRNIVRVESVFVQMVHIGQQACCPMFNLIYYKLDNPFPQLAEQELSGPEPDADACRHEHIQAASEGTQGWYSFCCACSRALPNSSAVVWVEEMHKSWEPGSTTMATSHLQPSKVIVVMVISKEARAVSGMASCTLSGQEHSQGGMCVIAVADGFAHGSIDGFNNDYFLDISFDSGAFVHDYYSHVVQVTPDIGYHRDFDLVKDDRVQWDPGGRRLGVKPHFKEGGMSAALLSWANRYGLGPAALLQTTATTITNTRTEASGELSSGSRLNGTRRLPSPTSIPLPPVAPLMLVIQPCIHCKSNRS